MSEKFLSIGGFNLLKKIRKSSTTKVKKANHTVEFKQNWNSPLVLYTKLSAEEYIKIHVFDDASSVAYGAVSFLRIMEKNDIKCKFVPAKLKLCLIKEKK